MHNKQQQKNKQQQNGPQQKVPEFTVAIVFPQHIWTTIHTLQSARDSKMVLLKLIQTGLPQPQMASLATKVAGLTQKHPIFSITFDTFVTEPSLSDATAVQVRLIPTAEDASHLCKLSSDLEKLLDIPASNRAFVPFIHISNVPKNQVEAFLTKVQQNFKPITITVQDLYFVSRDGKKDFSVQKSLPLAPPNSINNNNNNNNNNSDNTIPVTGRKDSPPKKEISSSPVKKVVSPPPVVSHPKAADNNVEVGPCFKYSSGVWVAVKEVNNVVSQHFKIATLNVLFDYHDSDKIHTKLRTPATLKVLEGLESDVIALEEVTSPFLDKLLAEEWVQKNYFISSLDVGYYGQVILSRVPFRSCQINLGKPVAKKLQYTAKKAVVAEFLLNGRATHVSAVHLTSDKSENSSEKRKLQLTQIDAFMTSRGTENFIVGDFNFGDDGDNVLPSGYEDVWSLLRPNEPGFTYDVSKNSLAQITSSKSQYARFDRILSGSNFWAPKSISLFGCNDISGVEGSPLFISDHFGVISEFEISSRLEIPSLEFSKKAESDPLFTYLKSKNLLADKSYSESRKLVLLFLTEVMEDVFGGEDWKMHLIGSSRFGIDISGADMDIVVIGNLARKLFFDHTFTVLSAQESVSDIRAVSDATVPVLKLTLGGVHIDIQYCNMPYGTKLPRSTLDLDDLVVFRLDKASFIALNGVRDSELIVRAVSDLESFRLLVLFVKMWAKERRIYSGSIGYLGGYPLAILAARICSLNPDLSPSQLVSQFFIEYGSWDLRTTPMSLPGVVFPTLDHKKHAVPIFTPSKPVRIASRNGTPATQVVLSREFERGMKIVKNGNEGDSLWNELVVPEDVSKYGAYLLLNISTKSESNFLQWAGYVDSRMVDLIIQIERLMKARDPAPAVRPCDRKYLCSSTPSLRAYFLIAVDVPATQCPQIAQLFASSLDFSAFSRGASEGMLISVDVTSDVASLISNGEEVEKERKRKRGNKSVALAPFHSVRAQGGLQEQYEEVKEEKSKAQVIPPSGPTPVGANNYAEAARTKKNNAIKYGGEFSEKKIRMRTSVEVFNRINWDASLPKEDFIIGFEGIMEVPFNEFDLESIPLHRIRIFKQNGVIVWSRNDRVDALFKY